MTPEPDFSRTSAERLDAVTSGSSLQPVSRVLVVDPSPEILGFIRYCVGLEMPGVHVDYLDPQADAFPKPSTWARVDVLLLDATAALAGNTTPGWLERVHALAGPPAVIVLAEGGNESLAVNVMKAGADDYIDKHDLSPRRLSTSIRELCPVAQAPATTGASAIGSHLPSAGEDTLQGSRALSADDAMPTVSEALDEARRDARTLGGPSGPDDDTAPDGPRDIPGYRDLRKIGRGGSATVYLGRRCQDDFEHVLKVIEYEDLEDRAMLRPFMREFRYFQMLDHQNVVRIYERAFANEFAYIAMEYFPGGDLAARIHAGLDGDAVLGYLRQIVAGLSAVHAAGLVHRDIKPANILFRADDSLAITDFGIARSDSAQSATLTNAFIGTPHYMSPERIESQPADARSDLYSVGVMLFEMLTSRRPFAADHLAGILHSHVHEAPPRLPPEHARYQVLVDGLLAKDPNQRLQSADDVMVALEFL